jgi:hypothetical protein
MPFLASLLAGPLRALGLGLAVLLLGFGLGVGWEHRGHTPPPLSWVVGQGLKAQLGVMQADRDTQRSRADGWKAARDAWSAAEKRCEGARTAERDREAAAIDKGFDGRQAAGGEAFDQGFAAGKTAGRRTCGDPNATSKAAGRAGAAADPVGGHVLDRPDDFAAAWGGGAYRPPGPVPPGR